jgi:hypothetical protein
MRRDPAATNWQPRRPPAAPATAGRDVIGHRTQSGPAVDGHRFNVTVLVDVVDQPIERPFREPRRRGLESAAPGHL